MINRDYTKEIGVESGNKTIPWPYAVLLLGTLAVAGWFVVARLQSPEGQSVDRMQAPAEAPKANPAH